MGQPRSTASCTNPHHFITALVEEEATTALGIGGGESRDGDPVGVHDGVRSRLLHRDGVAASRVEDGGVGVAAISGDGVGEVDAGGGCGLEGLDGLQLGHSHGDCRAKAGANGYASSGGGGVFALDGGDTAVGRLGLLGALDHHHGEAGDDADGGAQHQEENDDNPGRSERYRYAKTFQIGPGSNMCIQRMMVRLEETPGSAHSNYYLYV